MMLIYSWLPVPQQCRTLITTNLRAAAPRPSETSNETAPDDLIQLSEAAHIKVVNGGRLASHDFQDYNRSTFYSRSPCALRN